MYLSTYVLCLKKEWKLEKTRLSMLQLMLSIPYPFFEDLHCHFFRILGHPAPLFRRTVFCEYQNETLLAFQRFWQNITDIKQLTNHVCLRLPSCLSSWPCLLSGCSWRCCCHSLSLAKNPSLMILSSSENVFSFFSKLSNSKLSYCCSADAAVADSLFYRTG